VTAWMETHHVGATGELWSLTWLDRCLIAGRALWFYAAKLVWPHPLAFIYARWHVDAAVWWQYLFPLAAAATVAALHLARGWIGSGPLVAVLCYAATLAPALGFVNVYPMRYSFVADHFQYLASLPLIALAAAGATRLPRPQVIGAGVLLALGTLAWRQALVYRDAETIWRDTLAKDPDSSMAHIARHTPGLRARDDRRRELLRHQGRHAGGAHTRGRRGRHRAGPRLVWTVRRRP